MYKSAINPTIYWMVASGQVLQILGVMLVKLSMTLYICKVRFMLLGGGFLSALL
jgi:hypothetical protein